MQFLGVCAPLPVLYRQRRVGKTSIACAAAVQLAAEGKRVLLICADPASNAGSVLDVKIGNAIAAMAASPRLSAQEIDPQAPA